MINKTLFAREVRSSYKLLLIFLAVLALYGSMIVVMFDPKLGDSLNLMAESMPQLFAAFGMLDVGATLTQFIVNYLYGFLLIAFPLVFIVLLSNRLVARYVDRGSMAYLLATPNRRGRLARTQALVLLLACLCMVLWMTGLCWALSSALFPGELDTGRFLAVNAALYALLIFLSGVCFCASCCCNDTRWSCGIGAGAGIAFLLIQMISQAGEKFEGLKYIDPLTLFAPKELVAGESWPIWGALALAVSGLALMGAGIVAFSRRDLPV
ncbi:ABC transporter permease [Anaerofilum sp. BX8]|uniref:ABC transporter permease n=1 Tax=Anaerofilum hominis TaxID=2763016 RepID=A0A923IAH9_9FIRM|nr:ABC transporter permease subunit [Anaerofilum hominis]MBC5582104.1 ABC transporter permease [Anaerofilum hominis]